MKKKLSFLTIILSLIMLLSITVYADSNIGDNSKTAEEAVPMAQPWTNIMTTRGSVFVPATARVPGTTAYYIRLLQCSLNALGYSCGAADGIYGANTYNAIVAFQTKQKLNSIDGIAGADTWREIHKCLVLRDIVVTF